MSLVDAASAWRIGERSVALDAPVLMGVLNVTPDSFSDGGRWLDPGAAVDRALEMIASGAGIVDVGGESTRPGAARVPVDEQVRRTRGVIDRLRRETDVPISIDTTRAPVAKAAIDAGADIINDVSAGLEDDAMLACAATLRCGLVLMHRRLPPDADSYSDRYDDEPVYDDVTASVCAFLETRLRAAVDAGVAADSVVLDPGLGFGKSVEQNYRLIREVGRVLALGRPVLSAASRKSFLGAASGVADPPRRQAASVAVSVAHWLAGVRIFRVHDVSAHREALAVAAAITASGGGARGRHAPG